VHYKDRSSLIRSDLSARYQCSRIKKGYNPIRIHIICNPDGNICGPEKNIQKETPEPRCLTSVADVKPSKKPKIQREVVSKAYKLEEEKKSRAKLILEKLIAVEHSNEKLKEKDQECFALEKEYMVLKVKLDSTERKLKSAQVLANHYKKENKKKEIYKLKKTDGILSGNIDPMKYLCQSIEKLLGTVLPGKHAHEKASLIITALSSEMLFKGEGLRILHELKRQHIRQVFTEWRLLKGF